MSVVVNLLMSNCGKCKILAADIFQNCGNGDVGYNDFGQPACCVWPNSAPLILSTSVVILNVHVLKN